MDTTTVMAVATGQLEDDRRWANEARQARPTPTRASLQTRERWTGRLGAVAGVLAACALMASIPAMAGAPALNDVQPRPLPAPAPMVDFGA